MTQQAPDSYLDGFVPIRRILVDGIVQQFVRDVDFDGATFSITVDEATGVISIVSKGTVATGTGFRHITAGAEDVAASKGSAAQIPVMNAGGTDIAWATVSGDATLSAAGAVAVTKLTGTGGTVAVVPGVSISWATGNAVLEATAASSKFSFTFGGTEKASIEQTHGMLTVGGAGSDFLAAIGPLVGFPTANAALYLLPNGVAPTSGNCSMYADGTNLFTNCRWGTGTIHESFAGGSSVRKRDGANILLQESFPQIGFSTAWGSVNNIGTQAMADANQTPAAAVYQCTGIKTTGAITASRNLTLPTATDAQGYAKWINNTCTGGPGDNIVVKCAAGTTVNVACGMSAWVWIDSRGVTRMTADV